MSLALSGRQRMASRLQKQTGSVKSLQAIGVLVTLIFLSNYTFEVLALHNLYRSQHFLFPVLQATLTIWALTEVWLLRRQTAPVPVHRLNWALITQFLLILIRHLPWFASDQLELGPVLFERNSGFGASTFFLTAQMAIFLITSKFLIDAFAYSENTRAEQLAFQMILTERALEDFRHAKDQAEATAQALSQANNELHRLATTDPLTGAHNRRSLENAAKREIERLHRYGAPCSVITMDLDRFKMVNDTFGHEAGDTVLVAVCKCVRAELRQIDMLARWGGEEFVILLPHSELEQACRLAEAIRMRVEAHSFPVVGRLTASFGVAQIHRQDTLDSALKRSDEALYEAKASGRNRVNWRGIETEPWLQPPL